jgi:hypothetical protein
MNAKHLILGLFMVVLMSLAVAADRLEFGDVEVSVDGEDDKDLSDGDKISDEAVPGSKIKVDVEVKSNFTNQDEDADGDEIVIEDIEITVTLEGVDDGDELEEEIDSFDLDAGDDDGGSVDFTIPMEVGEGDYDIVIEVEGEDTNGTTHTLRMTLTLEVEKEKHELQITRAAVSPSSAACGKSAQLAVTVLNTGQEDEEDVLLTITSEDLGLDASETFDIDEGEFDDDMEYSKTFSVPVAKDVEEGVYQINVNALYDDGGEEASETVELTVTCEDEAATSTSTNGQTTGTGSTGTTTGTSGTTSGTTTVVVAQPSTPDTGVITPSTTTEEPSSLFDNSAFIAGIVILEVLIVIGGIAFVVYLMRKA